MPKKIEISHRTIIFTVFFLVALYFLYQIRQLLTVIFVAFVLMSALNPIVNQLANRRLPRMAAIILVYLVIVGLIIFSVASIFPPLIDQTTRFVSRFPDYLLLAGLQNIDRGLLTSQISQLGSIPVNLFKVIVEVFSNIIGAFFLLVTTFYLLVERRNLDRYLKVSFGNNSTRVKNFIDQVEKQLGGWVRAELTLMLIIGLMSYLGLLLLGIDFALPLAILAGLMEIIPNIGPIVSALPAVLAGLAISPVTGLATVALYFLIHQLENSLITPQVMRREAGINPLVTILALAVGFQIGQVAGAILAIPMLLVIRTLVIEFFPSLFPKNP